MKIKSEGFTLIEILIVVAIISILASVVLVGLGPSQRLGRDARRLSDLRQTQTALGLYFNKCGYYPGTEQPDPPPCGMFTPVSTWDQLRSALSGSGLDIDQIPNDPGAATGRTYYYGVSENGFGYVLGATLEDINNQAMLQDVDGAVYGVDCGQGTGDTVYCIRL